MADRLLNTFAENGDTNPVPNTSHGEELSIESGWSQAFERAPNENGYRYIDRGQHNRLWQIVTGILKQYQDNCVAQWFDDIAYPAFKIVHYLADGNDYISTQSVPAGTLPTNTTYWQEFGQFLTDASNLTSGTVATARLPIASNADVENATGTGIVSASQIGLRAATFGLDGRNMRLPINTSLNSDFPTGNYNCENFLDSPIDGWCHLFVRRQTNPGNTQYQEIVKLNSQPTIKYHRVIVVGDYQAAAWKRIYDSSTLPTVTQQEAIDPENTNVYAWTPQRVAQVAALYHSFGADQTRHIYTVGSDRVFGTTYTVTGDKTRSVTVFFGDGTNTGSVSTWVNGMEWIPNEGIDGGPNISNFSMTLVLLPGETYRFDYNGNGNLFWMEIE